MPCILSIFSVILFLRMGYILGQVRGEGSVGSAVVCIGVWVSEVRHCGPGLQTGVVHCYNMILVKVLQNVSSILTLDVEILQPILIHLKD